MMRLMPTAIAKRLRSSHTSTSPIIVPPTATHFYSASDDNFARRAVLGPDGASCLPLGPLPARSRARPPSPSPSAFSSLLGGLKRFITTTRAEGMKSEYIVAD